MRRKLAILELNAKRMEAFMRSSLSRNPAFDRVASHDAPQHVVRRCQFGPGAFGEFFDVFQKFCALRQDGGPGVRRIVNRPFQPCIADVNCQ